MSAFRLAYKACISGDPMQVISTLAAYGKALSRKQIMLGIGLSALISIAGIAVANFLNAPIGDTLSDEVGAI